MPSKKILPLLILALALTGCAALDGPQKTAEEAKVKLDTLVEETELARQQELRNRPIAPPYPAVSTPIQAVWLANPVEAHYGPLPAKQGIRLILKDHPVQFRLYIDKNTLVSPPNGALTVQEHLDSITAQANWAYEIVDGAVLVTDWQSVVLPIASLVGNAEAILKTNPGAAVADTDNRLTVNTNAYDEVEEMVGKILGEQAAPPEARAGFAAATSLPPAASTLVLGESPETKYAVSRAANLLYVSASPNQVREIKRVLDEYNASVSKRVIIDITVYDVSLSGSHNRHLDVNLLREAGNVFQITNTQGAAPGPAPDVLSLGYSGTAAQHTWGLVLTWLETQGTIIDSVQRRFDALNNHAVTFADTQEIEYIKGRSTEREVVDGLVTITPKVDIGNRVIGRTFQLLPTIARDRINIQLAINHRSILKRENYADIDLSATLFTIANADRMIPLSLGNGETRLLTYFTSETQENRADQNKLLPVVGDAASKTSDRVETVIVIRAQIVG